MKLKVLLSFMLINHRLQFFQHAFTSLLFLIVPLFIYFWPPYMACGILVLWPGMELVPPAMEVLILNHWTSREIPNCSFWLDLCLKVASHQTIIWKAFFLILITIYWNYIYWIVYWLYYSWILCFPGGSEGKDSGCNEGDPGSISGLGWSPGRKEWLLIAVFLPGKFHGQRSLVGYSPKSQIWLSASFTSHWN